MNNGFNRLFYRETVQDSGVGNERVIRQRNGVGVYAHIEVAVRALARGRGIVLAWNAGLNIPSRFAPAVVQGVQDAINGGVLAGLAVTDVHASVENGSYHEEDSTASAFREAAGRATEEALRQARPMILEALETVSVTVPEEFVAPVEASLALHAEQTKTIRSDTRSQSITATIPASHVSDLIAELLRVSEGQACISSTSAGFRPRPEPPDMVEQWVARTSQMWVATPD